MIDTNERLCEHEFDYGGIKYEDTNDLVPGSGARVRKYYDSFYCKKCLNTRYRELKAKDCTYDNVKFSATPIQK